MCVLEHGLRRNVTGPQNTGPLNCDMQHVLPWRPQNILHLVQNDVALGNLAYGICVPLLYYVFPQLLPCIYNWRPKSYGMLWFVESYRRFEGSLCLHVQGRVQQGYRVRAALLGIIRRDCGAQSGNSAYRSTTSRHIVSPHDRSGAGKSNKPRWQDAGLLLTASSGICLTGLIGRSCGPRFSDF